MLTRRGYTQRDASIHAAKILYGHTVSTWMRAWIKSRGYAGAFDSSSGDGRRWSGLASEAA
jgi:hypothetical protein